MFSDLIYIFVVNHLLDNKQTMEEFRFDENILKYNAPGTFKPYLLYFQRVVLLPGVDKPTLREQRGHVHVPTARGLQHMRHTWENS